MIDSGSGHHPRWSTGGSAGATASGRSGSGGASATTRSTARHSMCRAARCVSCSQRGVAGQADGVGAGPGRAFGPVPSGPSSSPRSPARGCRLHEVRTAPARREQHDDVAGPGVRANLPGEHLREAVVVADRAEARRVGVSAIADSARRSRSNRPTSSAVRCCASARAASVAGGEQAPARHQSGSRGPRPTGPASGPRPAGRAEPR